MQDTHDPFSYLLNEMRAHRCGPRPWPAAEHRRSLQLLLIEEAQELAWGRRHLSVIHGEILTDDHADALDDIVGAILDLLDGRWHRFGGVPDHHFTLTVDGPDAEEMIARFVHVIWTLRPSDWPVLDTPIVEVGL